MQWAANACGAVICVDRGVVEANLALNLTPASAPASPRADCRDLHGRVDRLIERPQGDAGRGQLCDFHTQSSGQLPDGRLHALLQRMLDIVFCALWSCCLPKALNPLLVSRRDHKMDNALCAFLLKFNCYIAEL